MDTLYNNIKERIKKHFTNGYEWSPKKYKGRTAQDAIIRFVKVYNEIPYCVCLDEGFIAYNVFHPNRDNKVMFMINIDFNG